MDELTRAAESEAEAYQQHQRSRLAVAEQTEKSRKLEKARETVKVLTDASLLELQESKPEVVGKIKTALEEGRISPVEAFTMSELSRNEPWENVTLAINLLRQPGPFEDCYFDDDGILQGINRDAEAVEGEKDKNRVIISPRYLTTEILIDPSGNVVLDVGGMVLSFEKIVNLEWDQDVSRESLEIIRKDNLWLSTVGSMFARIRAFREQEGKLFPSLKDARKELGDGTTFTSNIEPREPWSGKGREPL